MLLVLTILSKLLLASSQEHCITEYFLQKVNSIFTYDFQLMNNNVNESNDEYKCTQFLGLPNATVCGEIGLRFKLFSNAYNSSISLRYVSHINRKVKYEIIETTGKHGWNQWSKIICADFQNGVSKNFFFILFKLTELCISFIELYFRENISTHLPISASNTF